MERCNILVPEWDRDSRGNRHEGCLKPTTHYDEHLNKLQDGTFIIWEDVSPHDDEGQPIEEKEEFVWKEISKEEALSILQENYSENIPEEILEILNEDQ